MFTKMIFVRIEFLFYIIDITFFSRQSKKYIDIYGFTFKPFLNVSTEDIGSN